MNVTRNPISAKPLTLLAGLAGLVLVHAQVMADVPTPPPTAPHSTGFPSERALNNMGYDPKTGIWQVEETNRGKPTVRKDGGNITGTQGRNMTVTGKYGEKVNLQTSVNQTAGISKIQTAFAAANIGSSAVRAVEQDNGAFSSAFSNGEYGKAAMAASRAIGNFFDGFFTGGAGGYIAQKFEGDNVFNRYKYEDFANSAQSIYNYAKDLQVAQAQAERDGNLAEALAAAQAQKIAQEAAEAAKREQEQQEALKKQQSEGKTIWVLKFSYIANGKSSTNYSLLYTDQLPTDTSVSLTYNEGKLYSYNQPQSSLNKYAPKTIPEKSFAFGFLTFKKWEGQKHLELPSDTKKLSLTESEIADILRRMLESNQTNHEELMRQLSMMGNVVSESTINITYNQTTAKSAPYTPQGSRQAQQTEATVHKDGSITTNVIPRPDLKPDSSQAPTRQQVTPDAPNQPSTPQNPDGQHNPNGQNQNQKDKDFCDKHPDSLMCAEGGNADYEDVAIPHQDIPLDFSPADIFATDGVCPEPRYVDLGIYGKQEFSYDGICDLARKLRPLFILSTILACAYFIYASLDR